MLLTELLGQNLDGGCGFLGLRREEMFAEGCNGLDDSTVIETIGGLVDVAFGRLPVSRSSGLK